MPTTYHPHSDVQTKVVNRCLEGYLRCMAVDRPSSWVWWLPFVKWWYNTTHHTSIGMILFQALYGFEPPLHISYISGDSKVVVVDEVFVQEKVHLCYFVNTYCERRTEWSNMWIVIGWSVPSKWVIGFSLSCILFSSNQFDQHLRWNWVWSIMVLSWYYKRLDRLLINWIFYQVRFFIPLFTCPSWRRLMESLKQLTRCHLWKIFRGYYFCQRRL